MIEAKCLDFGLNSIELGQKSNLKNPISVQIEKPIHNKKQINRMTNQILIDLLLWILGFTLLMLPQLQDCIIYGHLLILLSQRSFIFKKGFDSLPIPLSLFPIRYTWHSENERVSPSLLSIEFCRPLEIPCTLPICQLFVKSFSSLHTKVKFNERKNERQFFFQWLGRIQSNRISDLLYNKDIF